MRRKPAEDRKADIVEAVLTLADQIGPDRLTTNDVARAVNVTQAAIFRHFPSKGALWAAVGGALSQRMGDAWAKAAIETADAGPEQRLRALVAAQLGQIERCPALPAILHSRELGVDNAVLRDGCQTLMLTFLGLLAGELAAMKAQGALRSELAPEDGAMLLISLIQGLSIRWTLGARNFALPAEGLRMFDIQLDLFRLAQQGNRGGENDNHRKGSAA
ncbi:MAG: TetR/AcrR family transcriptional regulator [Paracoccus sp. (in: a-proteobacteria)]|nr:TetR/AcrR family transcriptional regulator [Paracoccus sp. (in: a-proteobacteria)]